jgi:hypothetical protein
MTAWYYLGMKASRKGDKLFLNIITVIMLAGSLASLAYGIYIIVK